MQLKLALDAKIKTIIAFLSMLNKGSIAHGASLTRDVHLIVYHVELFLQYIMLHPQHLYCEQLSLIAQM